MFLIIVDSDDRRCLESMQLIMSLRKRFHSLTLFVRDTNDPLMKTNWKEGGRAREGQKQTVTSVTDDVLSTSGWLWHPRGSGERERGFRVVILPQGVHHLPTQTREEGHPFHDFQRHQGDTFARRKRSHIVNGMLHFLLLSKNQIPIKEILEPWMNTCLALIRMLFQMTMFINCLITGVAAERDRDKNEESKSFMMMPFAWTNNKTNESDEQNKKINKQSSLLFLVNASFLLLSYSLTSFCRWWSLSRVMSSSCFRQFVFWLDFTLSFSGIFSLRQDFF